MSLPIDSDASSAAARELTPGLARAIKRRLLERVADADESHLTIEAHQGDWQPFGSGLQIKALHEQDGVLSYLLRLEPGASLPPHRHPMDEECIVLEGRLRVGTRTEIGPGAYHLAHRGALHATISTRCGATIFLRGAVPEAHHALE
jgi:quercetin dioxygenase-like cupin family protein